MSQTQKTRVAVIYGGRSGEHEVSLLSAASVVKNLDPEKYEVVPIGIDKQGFWYLNDLQHMLSHDEQALSVQNPLSVPMAIPQQHLRGPHIDIVFPAMHGPFYEDGAIQGLLRVAGIPYVGANVLASAISMDKQISKCLLQTAGLPVLPFNTIYHRNWISQSDAILQEVVEQLKFPVFVKPCNLGSSVGIHKVETKAKLRMAVEDALQYDHKVLI